MMTFGRFVGVKLSPPTRFRLTSKFNAHNGVQLTSGRSSTAFIYKQRRSALISAYSGVREVCGLHTRHSNELRRLQIGACNVCFQSAQASHLISPGEQCCQRARACVQVHLKTDRPSQSHLACKRRIDASVQYYRPECSSVPNEMADVVFWVYSRDT